MPVVIVAALLGVKVRLRGGEKEGNIELGGSVTPKSERREEPMGGCEGGREGWAICGENSCCWRGGVAWGKGAGFVICGKATSGDW